MSDRTDALVQTLFNKPTLQDCSLQQVDYLAHQYPYFCTAQLLLLQKTKQDSEAYAKQLQRTALHFANPLLVNYWVQPDGFDTGMPELKLFQNPIPEQEAAPEMEAPAEIPKVSVEEADIKQEAVAKPEQSTATPPETTTEGIVASVPENAEPAEAATITFEPYHTVDYFASQGIKLSQQEAATDKLGKQVKSFTEWLKTMKRLPEATVAQSGDAAGERNVETLAAHSLDTADVVTESMAEVWLKQGKWEKAAEVYQKLSLRNPSKSAYFAAKIESLKKT